MALTTGQWNEITIKGFADSAWNTATLYNLPPAVTALIRSGGPLLVYCVDDSGPYQLAYLGGEIQLHTTLVATDSPETTDQTTMDDGDVWDSVRDGAGGWLFYSSQAGVVRKLTNPATLAAFIT